MKYLCHKWPRICSIRRKNFRVLSSFITYHRICNQINMTDITSGAGTATLSEQLSSPPCFYWGSCNSIFRLMCLFWRSLFVLFLLAIVLSVLLRLTDSVYLFGIFKLFYDHLHDMNTHMLLTLYKDGLLSLKINISSFFLDKWGSSS